MKSALEMLRGFGDHFEKVDVGNMLPQSYNMLVFSGMGGSGIVGEIMKSYLIKNGFNKPVFSIKGYELLPFVDKDALVVCISYSGDTEETISVFEQAIKVGTKIISISSGGKLEELSNKHGVPHIKIPTGYPPRYALGFMLNACLWLFGKEEEILDLKEDLKASSSRYEEVSKDIAKSLFGYVPIIYGTPLMEAAAYRFKTQINENSKTPAYNAYIPEMHHNEVVGYTNPDINQYLRFVIVADKKEHPRVSLRVNMTIDILKDKGFNPILISEEGNSYISRLLKNIYIGDFASYHLANMYGYDPLPVDIITYVKKRLQDG
jgi:glucose/mannose-6-phosphate isomerase